MCVCKVFIKNYIGFSRQIIQYLPTKKIIYYFTAKWLIFRIKEAEAAKRILSRIIHPVERIRLSSPIGVNLIE